MDPETTAKEVYGLAGSAHPIAPLVQEALQVIDQALDTHGDEGVSISFNGGKDCTVLLHLFAGALARRTASQSPPPSPKPIPSLYIPVPSPFPALETFIAQCIDAYHLDLFHCALEGAETYEDARSEEEEALEMPLSPALKNRVRLPSVSGSCGWQPQKGRGGGGMRRGLELYKEEHPSVSAILIGTRRGDPHGATLSHRNMTDAGWPRFERINPIINWDYADVWTFLKVLRVPYCSLYDDGYTSLGSTFNTFRNPALLVPSPPPSHVPNHFLDDPATAPDSGKRPVLSPAGSLPHLDAAVPSPLPSSVQLNGEKEGERYRPACDLVDGTLEREGRGRGNGPVPVL